MSETTGIVAEESDMSSFQEFLKEQLKDPWCDFGGIFTGHTTCIARQESKSRL